MSLTTYVDPFLALSSSKYFDDLLVVYGSVRDTVCFPYTEPGLYYASYEHLCYLAWIGRDDNLINLRDRSWSCITEKKKSTIGFMLLTRFPFSHPCKQYPDHQILISIHPMSEFILVMQGHCIDLSSCLFVSLQFLVPPLIIHVEHWLHNQQS